MIVVYGLGEGVVWVFGLELSGPELRSVVHGDESGCKRRELREPQIAPC